MDLVLDNLIVDYSSKSLLSQVLAATDLILTMGTDELRCTALFCPFCFCVGAPDSPGHQSCCLMLGENPFP